MTKKTIIDFVNEYKKLKSDAAKEQKIKSVIVNRYVPFATKDSLVERIIDESCRKDGVVHINSPKKYIMTIANFFSLYTNLEVTSNFTLEYDLLEELGLIEQIVSIMPETEISAFYTLLAMELDDLIANETGTHAVINNLLSNFTKNMDSLSDFIKTLDQDKVDNILEFVNKK